MGVMETYLTIEQVAERFGVSEKTVSRWVDSRGLPSRKVGNVRRFLLSEVDAWFAGLDGSGADDAA